MPLAAPATGASVVAGEQRSGDRAARARADALLFARYRATPSPALREQLLLRWMPLAHSIARRYMRDDERDDVAQVAALALVKAIDRYDPARGTSFASFATPTVLGEIKRYFRDAGWTVRVPRELQELSLRVDRVVDGLTGRLGRSPTPAEIGAAMGISDEQVLEAFAAKSAHRPDRLDPLPDDERESSSLTPGVEEDGYGRVEDAATVAPLLNRLTARDRLIVRLRFAEDLTQAEIGERLGSSQMQVSRLLRKAIAALQDAADTSRPAIAPGHHATAPAPPSHRDTDAVP